MNSLLKREKEKMIGRLAAQMQAAWIQRTQGTVTDWIRYHLFDRLLAEARDQKCRHCGRFSTSVRTRRMNTAYHEDSQNYTTCCEDCFVMVVEYYNDMWEDYYSMVM
jgi:hypothetical protein